MRPHGVALLLACSCSSFGAAGSPPNGEADAGGSSSSSSGSSSSSSASSSIDDVTTVIGNGADVQLGAQLRPEYRQALDGP
jgi:hypothetical protein